LHRGKGIFFLELLGVVIAVLVVRRAAVEILAATWDFGFDLRECAISGAAGSGRFVHFKSLGGIRRLCEVAGVWLVVKGGLRHHILVVIFVHEIIILPLRWLSLS
jgi:hypothetical protein